MPTVCGRPCSRISGLFNETPGRPGRPAATPVNWLGPVRPLRDGGYRLRIGDEERELLRGLCADLRTLIQTDDASVTRLFPAAFRDDPEASAEYNRLVRDELVTGRLRALDTVEQTLAEAQLDHEQAEAWCGALNDLRLVLGERLGITEDAALERLARREPQYALYAWLTWLHGSTVDALASRLTSE